MVHRHSRLRNPTLRSSERVSWSSMVCARGASRSAVGPRSEVGIVPWRASLETPTRRGRQRSRSRKCCRDGALVGAPGMHPHGRCAPAPGARKLTRGRRVTQRRRDTGSANPRSGSTAPPIGDTLAMCAAAACSEALRAVDSTCRDAQQGQPPFGVRGGWAEWTTESLPECKVAASCKSIRHLPIRCTSAAMRTHRVVLTISRLQ